MIEPGIQQIGRYKILGVIGQGGMGIVYRALDPSMAREVAIKMPHGDQKLLAHFQREVKATASFQHKNIVTVHTVDDFDGSPYMVMEYLDGQSMAEAISSSRILHLSDKISIAAQVCDALQYAHDLGVIHRDIKPANIYILKDRLKEKEVVAKVLDFGIARMDLDNTLTDPGQVRGSISYMSPEQIGGRKVDHRTDIYSAGVTLYQFLTGETPYKSNDPSAMFLKILNDPVPSLGEYIKDYPSSLDEIIGRAMAKNVDERYQAAEEFGYDLSRLLETIKLGMAAEFLEHAKAAALRKEWELARQQLLEILKLDRHHVQANELLQVVRQEIQKQQRSVQIQQLRSQAQIAMVGSHYEEALECVEQACRLAPDNHDLTSFRESIREAARRAKTLAEALRRGQAALYVGDLSEAEAAVSEALQCEHDHTEARALEQLIKKELAERSRRQQVQVFVEQARQEISKSRFTTALESLNKAREIDPGDSNIHELLIWASRGHEQEKRRSEIDRITKEIGQLLSGQQYVIASKACEAALENYPDDSSLLKLKQLADKQSAQEEKRGFIEEQSTKARHLSDAGSYDKAIELLESALRLHPAESSLNALLDMIRTEWEFSKKKKLEADRLREERGSERSVDIQRTQSLEELRMFRESLAKNKSSGVISTAVDRAGFLARRHATDREIQEAYQEILSIATNFRNEMDMALTEMSSLEQSMRSCQDVSRLATIHSKMREIQAQWPREKEMREAAERAEERMRLATDAKNVIQEELSHLVRSIRSAHSLTQVSLYVQQSKILSIEFANDTEIAKKIEAIQKEAASVTDRVEKACVEIRNLTSKLPSSPTLKDSEEILAYAEAIARELEGFEEVEELLTKASRRLAERKNGYQNMERSLHALLGTVARAQSMAELELIQARERDVLGKYLKDDHFHMAINSLEGSISKRKNELAAKKVLDEAQEREFDVEFSGLNDSDSTSDSVDELPASRSKTHKTAGLSVKTTLLAFNWKIALYGAPLLAFVVGASLFFVYPRSIEVATTPAGASIQIDGMPCVQPCTIFLKPGIHIVIANLQEHEGFRQYFRVSVMKNGPWNVILKPLPKTTGQPVPTVLAPTPSSAANSTAHLLVRTEPAVSNATVFLDNAPIALTDFSGGAMIPVMPGRHAVRITKLAYQPTPAKTITAQEGYTKSLKFQLNKDPSLETKTQQPVQQSTNSVGAAVHTPPSTRPAGVSAIPPIAILNVSPELIHQGQSAIITWETRNATQVFIDGLGQVPPSGSRQITPDRPTTYNLSAKGDGEPVVITAKIDVLPKPAATIAPPQADQDHGAIKIALNRYKDAYENESIEDMKQAWPSISKNQQSSLKQTFNSFNAIHVSLRCPEEEFHVNGDEAWVSCQQGSTYTQRGKKQPEIISSGRIALRKLAGSWTIYEVHLQ